MGDPVNQLASSRQQHWPRPGRKSGRQRDAAFFAQDIVI
jgi:hypothetical protein